MLAALNTGHEGGCGTVHANSSADLPARIEALGVAAGLSRDAVHSQLAAAVDVVVHLVRPRSGVRYVHELGILRPGLDQVVHCEPAVVFAPDGTARHGPGADRLDAILGGS